MSLRITIEVPAHVGALTSALEGLTALNCRIMTAARRCLGGDAPFPPLYSSGIRYKREPGTEIWQSCVDLLNNGIGDCEDLACYRAAELRLAGEPAMAEVIQVPTGSFHAVVRRADGSREDPSRILLGLDPRP